MTDGRNEPRSDGVASHTGVEPRTVGADAGDTGHVSPGQPSAPTLRAKDHGAHRPASHPVVRAMAKAEADRRYAGLDNAASDASLMNERLEWLAREVYRFPSTRMTVAHRAMARIIVAELERRINEGSD